MYIRQKRKRKTDSGVTLIEMLSALAVFSLLGVAGFTLLDQSLKARGLAEQRLTRLGDVERAVFLIKQDILGATGAYGERQAATGLLQFILLPSGVAYTVEQGVLSRRSGILGPTQTVLGSVSALEMLTVPNNLPVSDIPLDDVEMVWADEPGFQILLHLENEGSVEIVGQRLKLVPKVDQGSILQ